MTICLIFHNVAQKFKLCYANRCVVAVENKVLKEKSHINSYFLIVHNNGNYSKQSQVFFQVGLKLITNLNFFLKIDIK